MSSEQTNFIHTSEMTEETVEIFRGYTIAREVDSQTANFEKELTALREKYCFLLEIENYPV